MKFESVKRVYQVVNLLYDAEAYLIYSCMCENEKMLLYAISDEQLKMYAAGYFIGLEDTEFDGLTEIFSDDRHLFLAFKDIKLSCSAADILREEERIFEDLLKFFYKSLSVFCVHDIPPELACDILKQQGFGIGYDDNPACRYMLYELKSYGDFDLQVFGVMLSDIIKKAFAAVINKSEFKPISRYAAELEQGRFKTMLEIYEGYRDIYFYYTELIKKGGLSAKRDRAKAVKVISRIIKILRTVLVLVLILLSVWLLYLSLKSDDSGSGGEIDRIGDVYIEEYRSEE